MFGSTKKFYTPQTDGSPLAIIAILGYGMYLVRRLGASHVTHLQLSLDRIVDSREQQAAKLTRSRRILRS